MAIDKDKVFGLFGRYWEIAYNEGRTGEGFPDIANDVLAELRDALDADDGDVFTGQLVEIDGHTYGLRPGAARIVKEAMRDAGRYRWLRQPNALERAAHIAVLTHNGGFVATEDRADSAIDSAMAKDGA